MPQRNFDYIQICVGIHHDSNGEVSLTSFLDYPTAILDYPRPSMRRGPSLGFILPPTVGLAKQCYGRRMLNAVTNGAWLQERENSYCKLFPATCGATEQTIFVSSRIVGYCALICRVSRQRACEDKGSYRQLL